MIKLSDYVMRFVSRLGVRQVFLLPGGGCMHLVDSLGRCSRLEPVCCLHEQAAAIAAGAYAQYTNDLGVALVTTGPGGSNALTGVAGAWTDSAPVLIVSGQVKRPDLIGKTGLRQRGVQELDIVSMAKPVTKYAVTVTEPESIRYHLEKAVHIARDGRPGPVWIDLPLDVQGASIRAEALRGFQPPKPKPARLEGQTKRLIRLLDRSERPVILAGCGVRRAGGLQDFLRLARRLQVPVLTTWRAVDFLAEDDPLYFGRPGAIGQRGANFILQNCDLLLAIGARLDLPQIGFDYRRLARCAKKAVVDVDSAELAKISCQTEVELPIRADAGQFLRALLALRPSGTTQRPAWLDRCRSWRQRYPVVAPKPSRRGRVDTYELVAALSELMTPKDVLVPGSSGSCSEITLQTFQAKPGQRVLNSPGLGAMGFGLPESIGACLASGRRRTVSLIGDGGLQHNIQELQTLKRLDLPVKIFILNNDGYASIRNMQDSHFQGRHVACDPDSGLSLPDTCKVASAYGLKAMQIRHSQGLEAAVAAVLKAPGPVICEVLVDPSLPTAPRLSSQVQPDGRIVSKPLEDLWPFLDRQEFLANMIVPPLAG